MNGRDSYFRDYFDESLDANEFEIALSALCDFLLESATPGIASAEMDKIVTAFRAMELDHDERIAELRQKSQMWFPGDSGLLRIE